MVTRRLGKKAWEKMMDSKGIVRFLLPVDIHKVIDPDRLYGYVDAKTLGREVDGELRDMKFKPISVSRGKLILEIAGKGKEIIDPEHAK